MQDFEKLGVFYLGRAYDMRTQRLLDDLLLYDSKDLTTHGVCVGMTGSGKTGLCLSVLEEAAIDEIPTIAIDPKGDLGNLLLTFPELRPSDFRPWIEDSEAARKGLSADDLAVETARRWKEGLAQWGQDGTRIARFRNAAEVTIYTPGSSAGIPLTVLRSFDAPSSSILQDTDAMRDRVQSAVSGLLTLLGIQADPVTSREHILLANVLQQAWAAGHNLDLPALIRQIQTPPFDKMGFFDLETFFPAKDRMVLAMQINNLLASPGFAGWMEGQSLDIGKLLYTPEGRPRISILSIAHLSDAERMFFVAVLLNEVLSWARSQPGTSSLRALLYMDEIFGYFPPTANPPSKLPMLTLLKQARAYGLGVLLATQNPVDLDYKGLSNTGTWFIGRLQTERDKMRVLDGLEGASTSSGVVFDRREMDAILSALGSRVFLMHNVHDKAPTVFQTRWCLSYLRGPLTRQQIQELMMPRKVSGQVQLPAFPQAAVSFSAALQPAVSQPGAMTSSPIVSPQIPQRYLGLREAPGDKSRLVYRPAVFGSLRLHYVDTKSKTDTWLSRLFLIPLASSGRDADWASTQVTDPERLELLTEVPVPGEYEELPALASNVKSYANWSKELVSYAYQKCPLRIFSSPSLNEWSREGEREGEFRGRLTHQAREQRDLEIEKLRAAYAKKFEAMQDRVRRAENQRDRHAAQYNQQRVQMALGWGQTLLGAMLGRKAVSATTLGRAATAAGRTQRSTGRKEEIARAEQEIRVQQDRLADLEKEFQAAVAALDRRFHADELRIESLDLPPRKSDIGIREVGLVWTPWRVNPSGIAEPLYQQG
jgi:hypothetical protein